MTREKYISAREGMEKGAVDGQVWETFYEYWKEHRKEGFKEPDLDEFVQSFLQFLQGSFYPSIAGKVMAYYDEKFGLNRVLDKEGKILKTY